MCGLQFLRPYILRLLKLRNTELGYMINVHEGERKRRPVGKILSPIQLLLQYFSEIFPYRHWLHPTKFQAVSFFYCLLFQKFHPILVSFHTVFFDNGKIDVRLGQEQCRTIQLKFFICLYTMDRILPD